MPALPAASLALFVVAWSFLLHRFRGAAAMVDPELAARIGTPSLLRRAFDGHAGLIERIGRRDLDTGRYASLDPWAGRLRLVA